MMKTSSILFLLLVSLAAPASPLVCGDAFQPDLPVAGLSAPATALVQALGAANLGDALQPGSAPKWPHFQSAEGLQPFLADLLVSLERLSPEERATEVRLLLRAIHQNAAASRLFDQLAAPARTDYLPTEYDLKRVLTSDLIALIKKLPKDLRPVISKLSYDRRRLLMNREARDLVDQMTKSFDQLFATTGYADYASFETAVRSAAEKNPLIAQAVKLLDDGHLDVVMRRPENGRFWIPKTGFQNQYISGSSRGYNGKTGRYAAEATMLNRDFDGYAKIDDEVKPKYGTLQMDVESGVQTSTATASQYGSDLYVFKTELIADRLSVFPGDTLNHLASVFIGWSSGQVMTPAKWDQMFVPWSRRLLLVPFMLTRLAENRFDSPVFPSSPELKLRGFHERSHSYWESQIFGRLDLSMVAEFHFEGTPPSGRFLTDLKQHGIKIFDARTRPAVEWKEEVAP